MGFSWYKFFTGKDNADDPTPASKDWWKAVGLGSRMLVIALGAGLVILGALQVWNFLFPKPAQNINKPHSFIIGKAEAGAVDQRSWQVQYSEKPWELDVGVGALTYDNKAGMFVGVVVKRKW